jgi:hypothetical protein
MGRCIGPGTLAEECAWGMETNMGTGMGMIIGRGLGVGRDAKPIKGN